MANLTARKIAPEDNPSVAAVIRSVMTEFGAVGSGFSIEDAELENMYRAYQALHSVFYVVTQATKIVGCGGISPLSGGDHSICELRKMYLLPTARGQGAGRVLAELLIVEARARNYSAVYLETLSRMVAANRLYQRLGFETLDQPLGNTGHHGCNQFYLLQLGNQEEVVIG